MKLLNIKSAFVLFSAMLLTFGLVSCKDDERTFDNKAAVDAAGVYHGTWSVSSSDADAHDTVYYGSVQILPDYVNQGMYVGRIKVTRDDNPDNWPKSAMTNISHAGDDFAFFNSISRDTTVVAGTYSMGSTFTGRIYADHSMKMTCAFIEYVTYYVGKKEKQRPVIMTYSFNGRLK